jgi:hypothetical protein
MAESSKRPLRRANFLRVQPGHMGSETHRLRGQHPWTEEIIQPLLRKDQYELVLLSHGQGESLHPQSPLRDGQQISRGNFTRFPRTTAGFATSAFDGDGLRDRLPARPAL